MQYFDKIRNILLDLIFPIECVGCGREGEWLCRKCLRGLNFKEGQYCLGCKTENKYSQFCQKCAGQYFLKGVWIAGDYESKILSELIKLYKYRFVKNIGDYLGNYLSSYISNQVKQARLTFADIGGNYNWRKISDLTKSPAIFNSLNETFIVPVPLHKKRLRWRGYNQSDLLAEQVATRLNLDVNNNLIRVKHKKPQARLNEARRKTNIRNCYTWQGESLGNKNVILIDDVTTTGATLNECARVLKASGAREVWGLVVAKG